MSRATAARSKRPPPRAEDLLQALSVVLSELLEGTAPDAGWVLNRGDKGLLWSLDRLSARQASAMPPGGGGSIAAHVDHLCYGLDLLNRWSDGEENPWAEADYAASWTLRSVTPARWAALRTRLRTTARKWRRALVKPRGVGEMELNGIVASVAHLAYHVGAIRQIDRAAKGPSATD